MPSSTFVLTATITKREFGYELHGISLPAEVELLIKDSHVTNNFLKLTPFQTVL
jgi:hypothetical protein